MIPKIIHQIWLGGDVPIKLEAWSRTIKYHNIDWSHIIWDQHMLESAGFDYALAEREFPTFCGISDRARQWLLYTFGGIYIDMDVECIKPIDQLREHDGFAAVQDVHDGVERLCTAIIGSVPRSDWIKWMAEEAEKFKGQPPPWSTEVITRSRAACKFTIVPSHLLYPFYYDCPISERSPHKESLLVHHWEKGW